MSSNSTQPQGSNASSDACDAITQDESAPTPCLSLNPAISAEEFLPRPDPKEERRLRRVDPQLPGSWCIWEQYVQPKEGKKLGWTEQTKVTASFSTVRGFWGCWNHCPQPSLLLQGKKFVRGQGESQTVVEALMVFREGIPPEWENDANTKGGHFQLMLKPEVGGGTMDELWNNLVIGTVGGLIEPADMISGIRMVDRLSHKSKPLVRIELWFNDMDLNDTGKLFNLKKNFETFLAMRLDGGTRPMTWGYTETIPHASEPQVKKDTKPRKGR